MKKNIIFICVLIVLMIATILGIASVKNIKVKSSSDKIEIVATLFPQYDFAKQVGGDKVNVTLLLPPGSESHTYEPTPQDMIYIDNSKMFIYTGEEMEPWAADLISGMKETVNVIDISKKIEMIDVNDFQEHHNMECHENCSVEHEHEHSYDPHIWLNPLYAIQMVETVRDELCRIDPQNSEYYINNANNYINEIKILDKEIEDVVNKSEKKKIAFGGAFAYAYFVERYNLEFISAYESCGENIEPSPAQVKNVIDYIKQNKLPVIFYKEYSNGSVVKTISEATGAKMLVLNTVHNVSKEELNNGATYVSVMRQNLENIKEALK
ncbi:MAG: zinc ABC transporter substrate-binding protein [Clostridiales bacterium]|nr:zinc ABC transporter substrate-binding protein [Clostridiales bacterium]